MPVPHCRHFSGYKPCAKSANCDLACAQFSPFNESILVVHLGALGAVVRSTSLLAALRRKHPFAKIVWLTEKVAAPLLEGHPHIDLVVAADFAGVSVLKSFRFAAAYVIDKSLKAAGLAQSLNCDARYGFKAEGGVILPATAAAQELWSLGLDDNQKFFVNVKPETQLVSEALELGYQRDSYFLPLSSDEEALAKSRAEEWSRGGKKIVVGLNTGCSAVLPYKKLTVAFQRELAKKFLGDPRVEIVLLGGLEDHARNEEIAAGLPIHRSPTDKGLRDGLVSVAACQIVVTGDSLGMHLAISQRKWVVAWFGPTCAHEIDLFDRGEFVKTAAPCAPCWKRSCQKPIMCYDQVSMAEIVRGVEKGIQLWPQTSLYKPPFSETPSLPFPY